MVRVAAAACALVLVAVANGVVEQSDGSFLAPDAAPAGEVPRGAGDRDVDQPVEVAAPLREVPHGLEVEVVEILGIAYMSTSGFRRE